MNASEKIVADTYAKDPETWRRLWRNECVRQLACAVRSHIASFCPLDVDEAFGSFDAPARRCETIDLDAAVESAVAALSEPGDFRVRVGEGCKKAGVGKPRKHQVEGILAPLVAESFGTVKSDQILVSIAPEEIYRALADALSADLIAETRSGCTMAEAEVLERSLLIYYLWRWRMPFAQLSKTLELLSCGDLGLRASLVSIQNRHYEVANADQFDLPLVPFPNSFSASGLTLGSDVLRTLVSEPSQISARSGFFHRAMPIENPVDESLLALNPQISEEMAREARHLFYLQYEYTALVFMALVGIEYLLRTHCTEVQTGQASLEEILAASGYIDDDLRTRLNSVLSADLWNIRNRSLHGSFLEIESRRVELIMHSGICKAIGVPDLDLSGDGSLLENVAALLLELVSDVAASVASSGQHSDATWTDHFLLTEEELAFGESVHCDLLESYDAAEAWRQHIRDYLRLVTPCLSVPLQEGLRSWFSPPSEGSTLPGFAYLMLLFEPFVRLTLLMGGHAVMQRELSGRGGREHFRVQYVMLDREGLLNPSRIGWLTSGLGADEKSVAERTLMLAMKCRNAFAHGAIMDFTEKVRSVYGHLVVKSIQLVVEAGIRHTARS